MELLDEYKIIPKKKYLVRFYRISKKDFFKKFPSSDKKTHGMCLYRFNSNKKNICDLFIIKEHEDIPLWIHEITHAAVAFLEDKSFTSSEFLSFSDEKKNDYIHESIPRLVERLTRRLLKILGNNE